MNQDLSTRIVRYGLFILGLAGLAETYGFFTLQSWTLALVPWELNRMAGIFLASICAAATFPMLWIAFSQEYAALTGGGINFGLMFAGFTAFSFQAYAANPRPPVLIFGLISAAGCLATLWLIWFGSRHHFINANPLPGFVRWSFAFLCLNLIVAGSLLVFVRTVFPWQLTPQQSVLYGWIFLGAATYFLYGFLRPVWGNAQGQLFGFLAYDLILIGPFIALFFGNEPFLVPSLIYYIAALVFSGALGVYYLFINHETRISFRSA